MTRPISLLALLACLSPASALAQAPPTAPLVLTTPASARAAALGGAWVAGRDQDVIFVNPAQLIGARSDFALSLARFGPAASGVSMSSAYAAGKMSFTLGWGVQVVNFTDGLTTVPYDPRVLQLVRGPFDAQSAVATVGAAVVYKGFRIGAAAKYAADRSIVNRRALLVDLGVGRALFGGTAALAFQNLGKSALTDLPDARIPRQVALGWSTSKPAGPLDLSLFTQLAARKGFVSPAAGLEAGYSWIEGYSVTLRAGLRRPESDTERPLSLGAAVTGDRLTLEYALRMYDNSRRAHLVTFRWR
jgi:hypothetical protein